MEQRNEASGQKTGQRGSRRRGPAVRRATAAALTALVLGPAALAAGELRLWIEADGTVRRDDNYLQRGSAAAAEDPDGGEDGQAQTLARTGLRLDLSFETPRTTLALAYNPSYEESLDDSELSGLTQMLRAGLTGSLSRRSTLTVSDRLVQSRNFESVSFSAPPVGVRPDPIAVTRRGDQLWNSAEADFDLELSRRTSVLLGVSHTLRTFEENDLSDSSGVGANGGVRWHLSERRSFELLARAERFDFETERESEVLWAGVGYMTDVGRDGNFHGELGGYQVDSRETPRDPVESHSGVGGSLGLSYLRELYTWSVGYRHGVSAGIGLGRTTLIDSAYGGISTVGRKVTVGLAANASRTSDELHDGPAEDGFGGVVDTAAGTLRASWSFTSWGRLTAGYSRIWQRADLPPFEDLSYSRYFVGFGLRLYDTGERPLDPAELGETRNAEPDAR